MVAEKIDLEIVTPRGRALAIVVDEVTAPSVQGEFGILPGHLPLLAALRTGVVTYRQGSDTKKCAVSGGFAEAGPEKMVILTDDYAERDKVDPVAVQRELDQVDKELQGLEGVAFVAADAKGAHADAAAQRAGRDALIRRQNWLATQLELYGEPPKATQRPQEDYSPPAPVGDDDASGPVADGETK